MKKKYKFLTHLSQFFQSSLCSSIWIEDSIVYINNKHHVYALKNNIKSTFTNHYKTPGLQKGLTSKYHRTDTINKESND